MSNFNAEAVVDSTPSNVISRTFSIRTERLEWLQEQIAKLNKRADKIGCPHLQVEVGVSSVVPEKDRLGREVFVSRTSVKIVGEVPKYEGWIFAATMQHLADGECIIHNISLFEAPANYRNAGPNCEHCNYKRRRNDTYLVYNEETGEWKQVGSTCIDDFLGGKGLDALAKQADLIAQALGLGDSATYGDEAGPSGFGIAYYLSMCFSAIEQQTRFIGRKVAREQGGTATADLALSLMDDPETVISDDHRAKALKVVEWVLNVQDPAEGEPPLSEFIHNCRAVARQGYVTPRLAGYAAATIVAFERATRESDPASERSQHVGQVGERLRDIRVRVREIRDMTDRGFGYLHTVIDRNHSLYSFFYKQPLQQGQCYTITGTVKEHREFRGVATTSINRVVVA